MTRDIFILVPADTPDGPVKGAYALANSLAGHRRVTLVTMKPGPGAQAALDSRVERICLADHAHGLRGKLLHYRGMLATAGGRAGVASISMCLSADALNALCSREAITCASVRGNLIANYRWVYGWRGAVVGAMHLFGLRRFDHLVAMTTPMARQVRAFSGRQPAVIGNFIDEPALEIFRRPAPAPGSPLRFVFVGSLSERKQPWLVVRAWAALRERGLVSTLDLIGDGPIRSRVEAEARRHGIDDGLRLHGFLNSPYELIAAADALVLPSLSEGLSRAALEALHLGVPCVLRQVDGNAELIQPGHNGALFAKPAELADAMAAAAALSRRAASISRQSLLPGSFRQHAAAQQYLNLVETAT